MKILKLSKFVAMAFCLCGMFTACSSSDDGAKDEATNLPLPGGDGKMYTVSFNLENEKITSSESPLPSTSASKTSRADATRKTLYGINVYYAGADGNYNTYAYGLFDDKSKMKINLQGGYKYRFECTSVHELEDTVWHSDKNEYLAPFNRADVVYGASFKYNDATTILSNSFVSSVGTAKYLKGIGLGLTTISYDESAKKSVTFLARTDRYYGKTKDYDPTKGDGTVTINLNRAAFGLAYNITPPKEGTLTVSSIFSPLHGGYSLNGDVTVSSTDKVNKQVSYIYPFRDVGNVALNPTASYSQELVAITVTWTKSDGTKETFTKNITVKCNVMTTVHVDINKSSGDPSQNPNTQFNIVEESTPMTNVDVEF